MSFYHTMTEDLGQIYIIGIQYTKIHNLHHAMK